MDGHFGERHKREAGVTGPRDRWRHARQVILGRKRIPASVAVVACLYLAVGIGGFAAHFGELRAPDGIWVEVTESLAIVCGVFLMRGQNWARWLAIAWMAFHVAISFGELSRLAIHSLFLVLITWCLFHADAVRFFRRAETA